VAFHASRHGLHDAGIAQAGVDDALQLGAEQRGLFGKKIDAERLDGDEPVAFWFVGSKNRSENAAADLMQDAKGAERCRRRKRARIVVIQLRGSSATDPSGVRGSSTS
jgi:hypothetical protein